MNTGAACSSFYINGKMPKAFLDRTKIIFM